MLDAGVKRGDVVTVYMPMVPELAEVMLACAKIGAIHSVVFAGFSAESLKNRIQDCGSKCNMTCYSNIYDLMLLTSYCRGIYR
jgi:acetyl-CoA synthetase